MPLWLLRDEEVVEPAKEEVPFFGGLSNTASTLRGRTLSYRTASRKAFRAAIARYEGVLADYPDYERLDDVLFQLAQCLVYMARKAEAAPQLDRLLSEYPQSPRAGEAKALQDQLVREGVSPQPPPPQPQP